MCNAAARRCCECYLLLREFAWCSEGLDLELSVRVAMVLVACLLPIAGCGDGSTNAVQGSAHEFGDGWVQGKRFSSYYALQVVQGPSGAVGPGQFVSVSSRGIKDLDATITGSPVKLACAGSVMVVWQSAVDSAVLARVEERSVVQDSLPLPSGSASLRVVPQRNVGGALAVWQDDGTSFALWQLQGDRWKKCGSATGVDPPMRSLTT